ncbi:MAG: AI-2E family transporter [Eubacteriales bacterium]|nr:AI-2E family transporter [Eubacteriales bacterium]
MITGANWRLCIGLLLRIVSMLSPFIVGACIAFLINIPMKAIESRLNMKEKYKRAVSLPLSIFFIICVLITVIMLIIPQLISSLASLQYKIPPFIDACVNYIASVFNTNPELVEYLENIEIDWTSLYKSLQDILTSGVSGLLSGSLGIAKGIVNVFTNIGIGIVFAIYILIGKEKLKIQFTHLLQALINKEKAATITNILKLADRKFTAFFQGQCLEACILGTMFFIVLSILKMPYAVLIGVLIAVTALIPVFGAFVGLFIGAFLMLLQSPLTALVFVIIFFTLQQVEGNLVYPHVVGNSVELPAIWVLAAVTIGGSVFGVIGMIVFIPLFSVMYTLLQGYVRSRINENTNINLDSNPNTDEADSLEKENT